MAKTFYPFDAGPGYDATEAEWAQMARLWLATGVVAAELDRLAVSADGADMTVDVATGAAWIRGFYFRSDAIETLTIADADPFDPRIDRVVVRLDRAANLIDLVVLQGTPAADPVAPSLTQDDLVWEIELAQVDVPAAANTIAAGNVTDGRLVVTTPTHDGSTAPSDGQVPTYRDGILVPEAPPEGVTDHGLLSGLGDADHPQYLHRGAGTEQRVERLTSAILEVDTRSVALAYNASGDLDTITETDGATTVRTTTFGYNASGDVDTITETADGVTVTTSLTYDVDGNVDTITRSVA